MAILAASGTLFMERQLLTYKSTRQFSNLVLDYLDRSEVLRPFYNRAPALDQVVAQIQEKSERFSDESRGRLVQALSEQYKDFSAEEKLNQRINSQLKALGQTNTFTVTTGHQLNLFTGPLYFLYKIFGAINLAEQYASKNPEYKIIPVFWMASEDHDFE
ncbi:MAG TPA: bacillithiol biosynthesis cysteine-adding enzyme BshC, partial [Flavobacteriaceae bacterium]|nr:bacillithiol biosynthesis cysteine-adding enzyme BshC [Flavobacteriaceae bacterium]